VVEVVLCQLVTLVEVFFYVCWVRVFFFFFFLCMLGEGFGTTFVFLCMLLFYDF